MFSTLGLKTDQIRSAVAKLEESKTIYTTKGALCAQKLETVYFTSIFSTPSYSDIAPIDKFDLTFFYFYFVFEVFDTIQF